MRNNSLRKLLGLAVFIAFGIFGTNQLYAQDELGGPYEPDSATMLLMHFDGNLNNASDMSADGQMHGAVEFQDVGPTSAFGQSARIDNGSSNDSSFVTVPDTASLDLTGSWTLEGWINIFTFGTSSDSYKWVPRLLYKPGNDPWYTANYWMEMWGSNRHFDAGYYTATGEGTWYPVNSQTELLQIGQWYHWAFIRDTSNNVLISVIHRQTSNGDMERVFFGVESYDPINGTPPATNDNPFHIGYAGGGGDSFLDGWVDEIRVSNVVRDFSLPPIFTSAAELGNQSPDSTLQVTASTYKLGTGKTVNNMTLHYRTGDSDFQTVTMAEDSTRHYSATIPQQSVGSEVDYYYSATGSDGLTSHYPNTAISDSTYISFGIVDQQSNTLSLAFEEGEGAPVDSSSYGNSTEMVNGASYSEDAKAGSYALELTGDSAYVSTQSPFYASETFQVEGWFKPDSIPESGTALMINSGSPWYQSNFEIKFHSGGFMSGGSYVPGRTAGAYIMDSDSLITDSTVAVNEWNKFVYQVTADSAFFHLYDSEGNFVDGGYLSLGMDNAPILAPGPIYIGHSVGSSRPYFDGTIDNVRLYNYPKDDLEVHTSIDRTSSSLPQKVTLDRNYPNPFNPTTNITYSLPSAQNVTLTVYDVLGRKVRTLVDGVKQAGSHRIAFDGSQLSSGVYLYRLKTSNQTMTRKMLLVK